MLLKSHPQISNVPLAAELASPVLVAFANIPSLTIDLRLLGSNIVNLTLVKNWPRDLDLVSQPLACYMTGMTI